MDRFSSARTYWAPAAGTFGDVFYEATYSGDATHAASVSAGTHELIVPETTTTSVSPA